MTSSASPPAGVFDQIDPFARIVAALQAAEGRLTQIVEAFDHLESGVVLYGPDDRLVFCNRRFREIYSEVADMLVPGVSYSDIARTFFRRGFEHRTQQDEESYVATRVAKHLDPDEGDYEWLLGEDTWLLVSDRKTADGGVIGFRLDITARKRAEEKLAQSERRLSGLLEMSSDWYWEQDEHFHFRHISGGMARASGVDPAERYGRPRWDIAYVGITPEQMEAHRRQVEAHEAFREFQYAYALPDGQIHWVSVSGAPQFDRAGNFKGYRGVGSDITQKKRNEAQIREMAEYDYLTGLPNRLLLAARFEFATRQAERHGGGLALLFIDLDYFKNINDSLGHHVGDQILAETATRLTSSTRSTDTVARHGGDEFVVMLSGATEPAALARVAATLVETLSQPYSAAGRELTITPSIGIAIWPADGEDLNSLVKNADLAMYHSKSQGRNQFSFFRTEMNDKVTERLSIETALRRALQRDEFTLVYQPIFHLPARKLNGVEALLRWHSESLGPVAPARFIPIAEETGLIVGIGEWVVREACAQLKRWRDAGLDHFPVTVNVSAVQFRTRRVVDVLLAATREFDLLPSDVEIELTETALVRQGDDALNVLDEMGKQGFRLVVDDFGTGYSNLAYLKRFDISKLKIDRSFVRDITTDPDDAAITRGIIGLARSLGLRVVAEGVEHDAQLEYLIQAGCEEAQGYLLSEPISPLLLQERY
jgi:diguanylate cyclase (GGDEF)-like protein/PAS domain S-box-containing protein